MSLFVSIIIWMTHGFIHKEKMKKKKQPTDATLRNVRAAKKRNNVLTKRVFELEVEVRKLNERVDSLEAVQEHLLETVK